MQAEPLVDQVQHLGVIVTVVRVNNLQSQTMQPLYIEVRTQGNVYDQYHYESQICQRTQYRDLLNLVFNESFHYNTSELIDNNLIFVLKLKDGMEVGRHTLRRIRDIQKQNQYIHEKWVKLSYHGRDDIADLLLRIEFKDNQDLVSGIYVPDLSLVPKVPLHAKYNAIDGYNPNSSSNRANCFSCYDGDFIPGFDNIDIVPPKYKLPKEFK